MENAPCSTLSYEEADITNDNENVCEQHSKVQSSSHSRCKSEAPGCSSAYYGDLYKHSLVTPPEQFIDTYRTNICDVPNIIDKDVNTWYLEEDQAIMEKMEQKKESLDFIPKTPDILRSSLRRSTPTQLTSPISTVSLVSSVSQDSSWSNGKPASTVNSSGFSIKEDKHYRVLTGQYERNILPEEVDCEKQFAELASNFPAATSLEPLFGVTGDIKYREDFMGDILSAKGNADDAGEISENADNMINRESNISTFERMTRELHLSLVTKLEVMREEESCLELECEENEKEWKKLDKKFRETATGYHADKFKLHGSEIEKIVSLILSLTGRLVKIVNALDNMEWNGVDERDDLERKRDKLADQLEEAKLLWYSIDKRTGVVAGYIEQYLTRQEGIMFKRMLKRKVRLMLEVKEMQEKIGLGEKQLKAIQLLRMNSID